MRLTCPCCGATVSLEALLNDTAARHAVAIALALPANLGPRLLRYLSLFRPAQRSLTWDRAAHLLGELQAMIDAGQIQRQGRSWAVSPSAWQTALDEMLERRASLTLPLKSHGYLLEILAGQANQAEARQEAQVEADRRAVVRRPPEPPPEDGRLEAAKQASLQRFADLVAAQQGASPPARSPSPLVGEGRGEGAVLPPAHFRNLPAQLRGSFAAVPPEPEPEPHD
jgi:hypothetical protein